MGTSNERLRAAAIFEWLAPWHAAGTLGLCEARAAEQAMAERPELARRFEMIREERAATIRSNEALGAPSVRAFEMLMAGIAAVEAAQPSPLPSAAPAGPSRQWLG